MHHEIEIEVTNDLNIRFQGVILGMATSKKKMEGGHQRWTELILYQSDDGRYVCQKIGRTTFPGEHHIFDHLVCETVEEVQGYFGFRWLAKEVYRQADLPTWKPL